MGPYSIGHSSLCCALRSRVRRGEVVRVPGIEPGFSHWQRGVLPLNYTRSAKHADYTARRLGGN